MKHFKLEEKEKNLLLKYSAQNRKHKVGEEYKYSIVWRKYAHRISRKYSVFKDLKSELQNNICPVCSMKLYDEHLHHINYRHECKFNDDNYPNCGDCFVQKNDLFNECSEKTVLVHQSCHRKLHRKKYLLD